MESHWTKKLFWRSFGAIEQDYFVRNFLVAAIVSAAIMAIGFTNTPTTMFLFKVKVTATLVIFSLLYPYSRYVWDGIWEKVFGRFLRNRSTTIVTTSPFFVGLHLMLEVMAWLLPIAVCFGYVWILAPIGLTHLYYENRPSKLDGSDA